MKKIYLISPREPSGATWLINCLLELGIKTFRNSSSSMWLSQGEDHVLSEHEEILKKWLPALWDHEKFTFRNDIEIEWSHVWPTIYHNDFQIIYFTRDPRDSIFSRYKREAPDQTFDEFIRFPDVNTLLDKVHNWRLFNLAWMQHSHLQVFRFEDYKLNDTKILTDVLAFIGMSYSNVDIERAIAASTFFRAAEAEIKYRQIHPEDKELINRAGKAGEWRQGIISSESLSYIESVCGDAMRMQKYQCSVETTLNLNYSNLVSSLAYLQKLRLPTLASQTTAGCNIADAALGFAASLQYKDLVRAGLRQYEIGLLLDSLTELACAQGLHPRPDFKQLYQSFGLRAKLWKKILSRIRLFIGKLKRTLIQSLA